MPPRTLKRPFSGNSSSTGMPASEEHDDRQADDQCKRDAGTTGACWPVRSCRLRAQMRNAIAPTIADHEGDDDELHARLEERRGREQAAVVEEDAAGKRPAVAQVGQRLEHGVVPEQQLQQQRHVADHLDIAGGELRDQPVVRQPRDADDEAEDGREHDADRGDQQRVEQADPERAAVGRGLRGIFDQRLADIEAGGLVPEAEAGGDLARGRDCPPRCAPPNRRGRR